MHILIVRNNSNPQAVDASILLSAYLTTQSIDFTLVDSSELTCLYRNERAARALDAEAELAVALGGDGTILRTAHQVAGTCIPVLGINFGRLGFLANSSDEGVVGVIAATLAGDVTYERRTNLRIDVVCEGEPDPWEDDEGGASDAFDDRAFDADDARKTDGAPTSKRSFFALNELAVTRGANGRIIDFSLGISGTHIADMRGDGLVIATATGSTAYALSAGGPLVAPGFGGLVVAPLAAHTLHARPIVTSESDVVEMGLTTNQASQEASLFIDGELLTFERPVTRVYVRRGDEPTILVRHQGEGFYEHASRAFF